MSGMFESWLHKLVSALQTREKDANVVVVDWLPLAHQLYIDAVSNTRVVGRRVAGMLNWLQVSGNEREAPPTTLFLRKRRARAVTVNFEGDRSLWHYSLLNESTS